MNPSYAFAKAVFHNFDQFHFPDVADDSMTPEILKRDLLKERDYLHDVIGLIATARIQNVQDWLYVSGQLCTIKNYHLEDCTNQGAAKLIQMLNIPRNDQVSTTSQIWEYVFIDCYNRANTDGKKEIIKFANNVDSSAMVVKPWQINFYSISKWTGTFFNNRITKIAISSFVSLLAIIFSYPISYAYVKGLGSRSFKPYDIMKGSFLLGLLQLSVYVAHRLYYLNHDTQERISTLIETKSDANLQVILDIGGRNAYDVWMSVMEQAQKEGVCRLTASQNRENSQNNFSVLFQCYVQPFLQALGNAASFLSNNRFRVFK